MYHKRMLGYYPSAINSILEFRAIIDAESPEIETLGTNKEQIIADAYLPTMSERRVIQWETILGVQALENSTLESRRNNIMARVRGQGKLNTSLINAVVKTFTGNGCNCRFEDSTIYVDLLPFDESNITIEDAIINVTKELEFKIPAHLSVDVNVAYVHWNEVNENNNSWATVRATNGTWKDVMFGKTQKANMLDTSKLDELYLG